MYITARPVPACETLYTMVYGRLNFKRNNRFDLLSWSSFVKYFYTRRGYIIEELNEKQDQAWQAQKNKR